MTREEQKRFDALYARHLRALTLEGYANRTTDSYSRAVRRLSAHFGCRHTLTVFRIASPLSSWKRTSPDWSILTPGPPCVSTALACSSSASTFWVGTVERQRRVLRTRSPTLLGRTLSR
jgi:hypothetical protein